MVIPFYNTVGKAEVNPVMDLYDQFETYNQKVASGEVPQSTTFAEYREAALRENEAMCEKSLFVREGFNLKDKSALHNIQLGLFWYLIDVLHVFGLASQSASSNDYVTASLTSKRLLGQANYYYLRLLMDHYFCLDQIETDIEVVASSRVDLFLFYSKFSKNFKPEQMGSICETLRHNFGIHIIVQTPLSDMCSTSLDDGYSGVRNNGVNETADLSNIYFAYGLIEKSSVSPEQGLRFRSQPYKQFPETASPEEVVSSIPLGHRFGFGPITAKAHEAIAALCLNKPIKPWTKPVLSTDWRNTTLARLFTK